MIVPTTMREVLIDSGIMDQEIERCILNNISNLKGITFATNEGIRNILGEHYSEIDVENFKNKVANYRVELVKKVKSLLLLID